MPGDKPNTSYAVMRTTTNNHNGDGDTMTEIRAIHDTYEQARIAMKQDLLREFGWDFYDQCEVEEFEEEINAVDLEGDEYRVWIKEVPRAAPPAPQRANKPPVHIAPPVPPKQVYTIIHYQREYHDDPEWTSETCLEEAYESLFDANRRAREYFLYEVIFADEEDEDLSLDESNRDSHTLPYSVSSQDDETDEIFIEVKALKYFPASRPIRQQQPPPAVHQQPSGSMKRPVPPAAQGQPLPKLPRLAQPDDDDDDVVCLS